MIAILDYRMGNFKGVEFDSFTYTYKDTVLEFDERIFVE